MGRKNQESLLGFWLRQNRVGKDNGKREEVWGKRMYLV